MTSRVISCFQPGLVGPVIPRGGIYPAYCHGHIATCPLVRAASICGYHCNSPARPKSHSSLAAELTYMAYRQEKTLVFFIWAIHCHCVQHELYSREVILDFSHYRGILDYSVPCLCWCVFVTLRSNRIGSHLQLLA